MRYAIMLAGAFVASLCFLLFMIFIDKQKGKKRARLYLRTLEQYYPEQGVLAALEEAEKLFKSNSVEHIALERAVFYLKKSILRDYDTAFATVEKGFPQKFVARKHREILDEEQNKVSSRVYLLSAPSDSK